MSGNHKQERMKWKLNVIQPKDKHCGKLIHSIQLRFINEINSNQSKKFDCWFD